MFMICFSTALLSTGLLALVDIAELSVDKSTWCVSCSFFTKKPVLCFIGKMVSCYNNALFCMAARTLDCT